MIHPQKKIYQNIKHYFLFINSRSGGQLGKQYLTINNKKISFQLHQKMLIKVHLIDLYSSQDKQINLKKIKKIIKIKQNKQNIDIVIVVCGGDGTVLWVLSVISQANIDTNLLSFTIIPIGTGNDFSRCLGWGGSPIKFKQDRITQLKKRIIQWLQAKQKYYDIWHLNLQTYQDGTIIQIKNKQQIDTKNKSLNRGLCNYFGVGIDARICFSVQKKRQKNKWINLALYGCIGFCKLFQKIRPIHEAIQDFYQSESQQKLDYSYDQAQKLQSSRNSPLIIQNNKQSIVIKQGYSSLLALNSVRYMAGLKNVWNTNKHAAENINKKFQFQSYQDGKIQFLAFKNQLKLGLERFINSGAKVTQGQGPFIIKFNRTNDNTPTFIHIDGEAMKIKQLKTVTISKSKMVKQGKIRVLVKNNQD